MKKEFRVEAVAPPISHYCDAVQFGDLLFISGVPPTDKNGKLVGVDDVVAQTRQVFENLRRILEAAGATFADVAKITLYLTDVGDRASINPVRQEYFGDARPASTLVEVSRLVLPEAKVEIELVAQIP